MKFQPDLFFCGEKVGPQIEKHLRIQGPHDTTEAQALGTYLRSK